MVFFLSPFVSPFVSLANPHKRSQHQLVVLPFCPLQPPPKKKEKKTQHHHQVLPAHVFLQLVCPPKGAVFFSSRNEADGEELRNPKRRPNLDGLVVQRYVPQAAKRHRLFLGPLGGGGGGGVGTASCLFCFAFGRLLLCDFLRAVVCVCVCVFFLGGGGGWGGVGGAARFCWVSLFVLFCGGKGRFFLGRIVVVGSHFLCLDAMLRFDLPSHLFTWNLTFGTRSLYKENGLPGPQSVRFQLVGGWLDFYGAVGG